MKLKFPNVLAGLLLLAPGFALADHGEDPTLAGQLVHAIFDPLHLGVSLLIAAGLYALYRLARRNSGQGRSQQ